jgi:hypothetical protein
MSGPQRGSGSVVDNIVSTLTEATASAWEARCAWLLKPELPNFILGSEGSSADCGLLFTDETLPPMKVTDRLSAVRKEYGENALAILLDFKMITPSLSATFKGGLYYYRFHVSPKQKLCAAFIVQNPAAPHLVALIPQSYIERCSRSRQTGHAACYGREGPSVWPAGRAIPHGMDPLVMPVHFLPEALRLLHAFCRGRRQFW